MDLSNLYTKKNNIFQSDLWREFQAAVGREVVEIEGVYFFKADLIKGKEYLFAPKGSLERYQVSSIKYQVSERAVFLRAEPDSGQARMTKEGDLSSVTKKSPLSQQYSPKQTLVLDLSKSEDDLLAKMKSKHRYNIRLAEKKGVTVKSGFSREDVANFYKLSLEVGKRDKTFSPHDEEYYLKMAETLGPKGNLEIFTAFFENEPIASILILFYNETAIYLHGASSNNHRELMPNHLAQWTAILEAKKRGCKYYDFWGIAVENLKFEIRNSKLNEWTVDENHPWAGITKFKLGFVTLGETGEVVEFPGAFDLIIRPFWYRMLCLGSRLKKIIKQMS